MELFPKKKIQCRRATYDSRTGFVGFIGFDRFSGAVHYNRCPVYPDGVRLVVIVKSKPVNHRITRSHTNSYLYV